MPITLPNNLPAGKILEDENIFVMYEDIAFKQDIRPLKILMLNLMPKKLETEVQLLRRLSNTPLQLQVDFIYMETHKSKNTSMEYLETFYKVFSEVKETKYDGFIITGAPIENMPFEEVNYWEELTEIFEWSKENVTSTLHICWGAQAGLYHHFGVEKYPLENKMFGVFPHTVNEESREIPLVRGYDDLFYVPHSRHTTIKREDVLKHENLSIVSESNEAGVYIVVSDDIKVNSKLGKQSQIFITGHSEYDPLTLKGEYERDSLKNLPINIPKNYFKNDDPSKEPVVRWRGHSSILFNNWLNYYVYQSTKYEL